MHTYIHTYIHKYIRVLHLYNHCDVSIKVMETEEKHDQKINCLTKLSEKIMFYQTHIIPSAPSANLSSHSSSFYALLGHHNSFIPT